MWGKKEWRCEVKCFFLHETQPFLIYIKQTRKTIMMIPFLNYNLTPKRGKCTYIVFLWKPLSLIQIVYSLVDIIPILVNLKTKKNFLLIYLHNIEKDLLYQRMLKGCLVNSSSLFQEKCNFICLFVCLFVCLSSKRRVAIRFVSLTSLY